MFRLDGKVAVVTGAPSGLGVVFARGLAGAGAGAAGACLARSRPDGKVAVVTGASSGLGVVFARALAEAGADVALGARREDRMAATSEAVEAAGRRAVTGRPAGP